MLNAHTHIVSAGFDAARGDHLGGCDVTPDGYAHMTHMLAGLAGGKLVVALEVSSPMLMDMHIFSIAAQGGYSLEATASSALAVTRILLGEAPPRVHPMTAQAWATKTVWDVARIHKRYWKSLDVAACDPYEERMSVYCASRSDG
jgi:histone deacetylase 6